MRKLFLYLAIVAVAVSCNSEDLEIDSSPMITETISGTYCPATKATIADTDASFKWSVGDNIAVHVSNGDSHKYVFTSGEGGASQAAASASFSVTYDSGYSRDAFAVYPSTIVSANATHYGQSGSTLDVTLPSSYTLSQVAGEVSPCPMVATNTASSFSWDFYQLCSLLRITVNDIPATAKRLEIDFDGKKVWGDFSIASSIVPGTSVIATTADADHDIISITKDGTDAVLGETSLALNIPLPVGEYTNISITAFDDIVGGNPVSASAVSFSYTAVNTKGVKKTTDLSSQISFTFTIKNEDIVLPNVRFVRIFSSQNKLYNDTSTYGPFTVSDDTDITNPIEASLRFDSNPSDQLVFQVIDGDGTVYSGSVNAPTSGYEIGHSYDITADVNLYTFTVASGKKVCFSPGDLGVDNDVYTFTEPFTAWGQGSTNLSLTKRVWFNYPEVYYTDIENGHSIYGVKWRIQKSLSTSSPTPHEWDNIIGRIMKSGVAPYYRVSIQGHQYCLLLPPNETQATDIEDDLTSGTVNNYLKYIAKGFVLLMNTGQAQYWNSELIWGEYEQGWYWAVWNNMTQNRTRFSWNGSNTPHVDWATNEWRFHVRYMHDVDIVPGSGGASGGSFDNGFNNSNGEEEFTW